jgi:hypothetical protein
VRVRQLFKDRFVGSGVGGLAAFGIDVGGHQLGIWS